MTTHYSNQQHLRWINVELLYWNIFHSQCLSYNVCGLVIVCKLWVKTVSTIYGLIIFGNFSGRRNAIGHIASQWGGDTVVWHMVLCWNKALRGAPDIWNNYFCYQVAHSVLLETMKLSVRYIFSHWFSHLLTHFDFYVLVVLLLFWNNCFNISQIYKEAFFHYSNSSILTNMTIRLLFFPRPIIVSQFWILSYLT